MAALCHALETNIRLNKLEVYPGTALYSHNSYMNHIMQQLWHLDFAVMNISSYRKLFRSAFTMYFTRMIFHSNQKVQILQLLVYGKQTSGTLEALPCVMRAWVRARLTLKSNPSPKSNNLYQEFA